MADDKASTSKSGKKAPHSSDEFVLAGEVGTAEPGSKAAASLDTWAKIKAAKKAPQRVVRIQIDGAAKANIERLRAELDAATRQERENSAPDMGTSSRVKQIQRELSDAIDAAEATEVEFVFQAIGRAAWDRMVMDHKPTQEQIRDLRRDLGDKNAQIGWNPETFPPAIISACLVSPRMTVEEATEMYEDPSWNLGELQRLLAAAIAVNQETPDVGFTRGAFARTLASG